MPFNLSRRDALTALAIGATSSSSAARAAIMTADPVPVVTPGALEACLEKAVAAGTPGIAAAIGTRRGVIWSGIAGEADVQARRQIDQAHLFGVGSITKVFVAVAILQLIDEGKIARDSHCGDILPSALIAGVPNAAQATIDELLAHRSGVPSWEDDPKWIRLARGADFKIGHRWGKSEPLNYVRGSDHRPTSLPGAAFNYSNSGYTLLGLVIEQVTGQPAEREIRRRILSPLALADSYIEGFEPSKVSRLPHRYHYSTKEFVATAGVAPAFPPVRPGLIDVSASDLSTEWTAGGLISSPRDLVQFATALRDGRLLTPSSLDYMRQWRPARPYAEMGHGLFRFATSAGKMLGHAGSVLGFTGGMAWAESGDAVVAVLANVGTMHAGDTPPAAYDVALRSDFTGLALRYAAQQG